MSAAHRDEIAKLESLYAENPEGRVFTHLAEAYRKAGELDRAREILSSGIERHPDYSSAHVVLGRVLMDQGEGGEADAAFQRVLELDPHNLIAMRSRADIARDQGDSERAITLYDRLLDQEPGDDEVREIVDGLRAGGGAREESAAQEPADAFSYDSFEDDAEDAEVRTETIAQVYARQGLYDRAAEVYRELSRARPEDDSLRERLAEMEQLAEAQSGGSDEVDAVSDYDTPAPSTGEAQWEESPWDESPWSEPDQPAEEESPWSTSALDDADDADAAAPWEQTSQPTQDPAEPLTDESQTDASATDEPATDEPAAHDPELGEMPAAGAYHDQWRTEGDDERESDDGHPEVFHVEGLESSEVDTSGAGADQLEGIEVDEVDPETGLRTGATPDTAAPAEDLSEEMDVRDVPEPPAEGPWADDTDVEEEPSWLSGVGTPGADISADAEGDGEEDAAESIWSGADWEDDTSDETTPHAWTYEDEDAEPSPPVRDYFGGLLGWSGSQASPADASSDGHDTSDLPGAMDRSGGSDVPGSSGSHERASSAEQGEDDDDLDMFRSWLESLKQ